MEGKSEASPPPSSNGKRPLLTESNQDPVSKAEKQFAIPASTSQSKVPRVGWILKEVS